MRWPQILGRTLHHLVNLGLAAFLALQGFLIVQLLRDGEVPLPAFVLQAAEDELAAAGFRMEADEMHFDLRGIILAQGVRLYSTENSEPFFRADYLLARFGVFRCLIGDYVPSEIGVAKAEFDCPAVASPSGHPETVLRQLYVNAHQDSGRWTIETLLFEILGAKITAGGEFFLPLPSPSPEAAPPTKSSGRGTRDLVATYIGVCRQVLDLQASFDQLDSPVLRLVVDGERDGPLNISAQVYSDGFFNESSQVKLGAGSARVNAMLGTDGVLRPAGLGRVEMNSLQWEDTVSTAYTEALVRLGEGIDGLLSLPETAELYCYNIEAWGLPFGGAFASLDLRGLRGNPDGSLTGRVALKSGQNWIAVDGPFRPSDQSGQWQVEAYWNPEFLLQCTAIPPEDIPAGLDFHQRSRWRASMDVLPGAKPGPVSFEVWLGATSFEDIHLEAAQVVGRATADELSLDEVELWGKDYHVSGAFRQDFASKRYSFEAKGTVWPQTLNVAIEDEWWHELWSAVQFKGGPPEAEIAMSGRLGADGLENRIFGKAVITDAHYHGQAIQRAATNIWQTTKHLDLYDFRVRTSQSQATTHLHWQYQPGSRHREFLSFRARTHMPLAQAAALTGAGIESYAEMFPSQEAPYMDVAGLAFGERSPRAGELFLKLNAFFPGPFEFEDVRFSNGSFLCQVTPDRIDVSEGRFGLGDGHAALNAALTRQADGGLFVDNAKLSILNARLAGLYEAVPFLRKSRARQQQAAREQGVPSVQPGDNPYAGVVKLYFNTRGQLPDLDTFSGNGAMELTQAKLGQLHLLGGLSRFLYSIGLHLGTLNFDAAKSDFTLARGNLNFPDVRVTGSTGMIQANGNFQIDSEKLDFLVSLHPFGNIDTPVVSQVFSVFSPIADSLEVELTGTLNDPEYQVSIQPFAVFTGPSQVDNPNEGLVETNAGTATDQPKHD